MLKNPLIFDIQRGSLVDGPGIRTTIFFKGCNLRCAWCHNPESQKHGKELAVFLEKCVGCGACKIACKNNENCALCENCVAACPTGARKIYGKKFSLKQLFMVARKDKNFYAESGGGVTLSGGECMLYPAFVAALAKRCKAEGISVAVDTAGNVPWESFESVLHYVDLFLYDVKCITPDLHKKFTGADNALILQNLKRLQQRNQKIIVRVPVIPDFNEGEELDKIKKFVQDNGLQAEYLAYHAMGQAKAAALQAGKRAKR